MSDKYEVRNAIIRSTKISTERVLSAWLNLDYGGGSHQGFGGWMLYRDLTTDKGNFGGHFILRCIEIGGVEDWEQLPGKTIRVRIGSDGLIKSIGHIVKDDWFMPAEDFKRFQT